FAFARNLIVLFASRVIAGAGGANIGTAQAYIADITTREDRAKGMGLIGAAFGMGFILGPPLSGGLAHIGSKLAMAPDLLPGICAGSLSLLAFLVALFVLGESKAPDATVRSSVPPQFDREVWRGMSSQKILLAIMSTIFIALLAVAGMETSVTLHARDRFGFKPPDLAYFFLFMG